jgi:hypothetical protein
MTTNIVETLPWIDYKELYEKIEERGEEKLLRAAIASKAPYHILNNLLNASDISAERFEQIKREVKAEQYNQ